MKKLSILLLAIIFFAGTSIYAQSSDYNLAGQSSMAIQGTSSLHDWECAVEDFSAKSRIITNAASGEPLVEQFTFSAEVESIECGKRAMNKKTYGALKEKDHPSISFSVTEAIPASEIHDGKPFGLEVTGDLTIAGVTQSVSFPATGQLLDNDRYQFDGSCELNMNDYNIDPPSAMFGSIRTGEDVKVSFSIVLSK